MKRKILFRLDAGNIPEIGTGHLRRCLLVSEICRKRGAEILFLTESDQVKAKAEEAGIKTILTTRPLTPKTVSEALAEEKPHVVVWDRLDTDVESMQAVKKSGAILITLDDSGPGQSLADITINAMVEPVARGYNGYDYVVMAPFTHQKRKGEKVERIFLAFGGYDHNDLTLKAMRALASLSQTIDFDVVVGNSYPKMAELKKTAGAGRIHFHQDAVNFGELLSRADIAVVNGGLTLAEALARGIPSLGVAQYNHQVRTIAHLEKRNAAVNLGPGKELTEDTLRQAVDHLIHDQSLRQKLAEAGPRLVDGEGLSRVAELALVAQPLSWDSDFFGVNIAYLYPRLINKDLVDYAFKKCKEDSIECLYYLCDCHDSSSVRLAEQQGFHFVDIRLSFFLDLNTVGKEEVSSLKPLAFRKAVSADIPTLRDIAADSYVDSRYYFDQNFKRELCAKFYSDWVAKSVEEYADQVIVADKEGVAVGYIACKMKTPHVGQITLVGVGENAKGHGVGNTLVLKSLEWFKAQGAGRVEVVTQGRNYYAQRLYQKCGFKTLKTELWYHKWFR